MKSLQWAILTTRFAVTSPQLFILIVAGAVKALYYSHKRKD